MAKISNSANLYGKLVTISHEIRFMGSEKGPADIKFPAIVKGGGYPAKTEDFILVSHEGRGIIGRFSNDQAFLVIRNGESGFNGFVDTEFEIILFESFEELNSSIKNRHHLEAVEIEED